ncbi:MAG: flagellar hook assembly protein FlgD [Rhodospirillaceae bacterium]|jgi:flagellar basal-body rod modification protein FlgD|nr:flagellar hook assembly protein FlgD [Rhodospirillaceae bacterium]MBT6118189.1 flagellar hook assembly protein FlgD [Rhodospirillaceae bacterium]
MEIQSLFPGSTASKAANDSAAGLGDTFDSFLTLLTTQLKNQDPMSPLDPTEFTAQLVQFTNVEQQIRGNQTLERLVAAEQANQTLAAANYLGATVEAAASFAPLTGTGAEFFYTLDTDSDQTLITVFNEDGAPVYQTLGATEAGKHAFHWNGEDADGNLLPEGPYRISVTAHDSEGPVTTDTGVVGRVTGIAMADGEIALSLDSIPIPLSQVLEVRLTPVPVETDDDGWF